ncbi:MAG: hypothetical protein GEV10_30975 [Streptosporangiales bacterium]|nr:hypothetical protein [Streptosporangiales bacterium]
MAAYTAVGFANVHLTDSWVLDVTVRPGEVVFDLDLVVLPSHPSYDEPLPGEQYCYRSAALRFPDLAEVTWTMGTGPPAIDADGEIDYGNIDTLRSDGDVYELSGDWGAMRIVAGAPVIDLG